MLKYNPEHDKNVGDLLMKYTRRFWNEQRQRVISGDITFGGTTPQVIG